VEGALGGDDRPGPAGAPRQLDGRLDRLGAGVVKKTADPPAPRDPKQRLGQLDLRLAGEEVETWTSLPACFVTASTRAGMVVPEGVDGDPGEQVEVALAVDVPDVAPLAVGRGPSCGTPKTSSECGVAAEPGSRRVALGAGVAVALMPWGPGSCVTSPVVGQDHRADALGR
jgi:hypothetical protein